MPYQITPTTTHSAPMISGVSSNALYQSLFMNTIFRGDFIHLPIVARRSKKQTAHLEGRAANDPRLLFMDLRPVNAQLSHVLDNIHQCGDTKRFRKIMSRLTA